MKRLLVLLLACMFCVLCACVDTDGQVNSSASPDATAQPTEKPQHIEVQHFECEIALTLPFEQFITEEEKQQIIQGLEDWVDADSEWKRLYLPQYNASDGKLLYVSELENRLYVIDLTDGSTYTTMDVAPNDAICVGDRIYTLNRTAEEMTVTLWEGDASDTLTVPAELYQIESDPDRPDAMYLGATGLCVIGDRPCIGVMTYDGRVFYELDFETGTFDEYTLAEGDDAIAVDDEGNVYAWDLDLQGFCCHNADGELIGVCPAGDYFPVRDDPFAVAYGGDGCLYFLDWNDEGYVLIRARLIG